MSKEKIFSVEAMNVAIDKDVQLNAKCAQLTAELAEARRDGERLIWVIENAVRVIKMSPAGHWTVKSNITDKRVIDGYYATPRAAIDVAMTETK